MFAYKNPTLVCPKANYGVLNSPKKPTLGEFSEQEIKIRRDG
jgi:hypothetical protein